MTAARTVLRGEEGEETGSWLEPLGLRMHLGCAHTYASLAATLFPSGAEYPGDPGVCVGMGRARVRRKLELKLCLSPVLMSVACSPSEPQFPVLENGDSHKLPSSPGTEVRVGVSLADPRPGPHCPGGSCGQHCLPAASCFPEELVSTCLGTDIEARAMAEKDPRSLPSRSLNSSGRGQTVNNR